MPVEMYSEFYIDTEAGRKGVFLEGEATFPRKTGHRKGVVWQKYRCSRALWDTTVNPAEGTQQVQS